MQVTKITPRGFCHGVVSALKMVYETITNENIKSPVYLLGMIVHNKQIVDAFTELGVITIEDKGKSRLELLEKIDSGTVIFTAHGISPKVIATAKEKGLDVVDATCSDVYKTHHLIEKHLNAGYRILYIGQKGHPEPEGAIGINPDKISIIQTIEDLDNIDFNNDKIFITNQTTMSLYDVYNISEAIKSKFPNAEFADELCNSTRIRQEAVKSQDYSIDLCIVVGDPNSNNTKKLAEVSNINSIRIADIFDLDLEILKDIKHVSVTSGASTPTSITKQVTDFLEQFNYNDKSTWNKGKKLTSREILSFIK